MSSDRERNTNGQYTAQIPADAALDAFENRDDLARPVTASDVMEVLDCSRRTAHNKLSALVEAEQLKTRKVGARGRVWWKPIAAPQVTSVSAQPRDPVLDAIAAVSLPGSGETLTNRQNALYAAYEYLVEHPSAKKSDFLETVYPEHPAAFETPEGWWNAIQPALKELPGVDPPEERGQIWKFLGGDRFTPTLG